MRFFKTGLGQDGEGDDFLGPTVPEIRLLIKNYTDLPLIEVLKLLQSTYHESRLAALIILVDQYKKGSSGKQRRIYELYLNNTVYINNWDLIDSSAEFIVGPYLENSEKQKLVTLAHSSNIWERRIGILACFHYIKKGNTQ